MDKESYNVDDILSEVKKRREENEARIKSDDGAKSKSDNIASAGKSVNQTRQKPNRPVITEQKKEASSQHTAQQAQRQPQKKKAVSQNAQAAKASAPKKTVPQNRDIRSREVPKDEQVYSKQQPIKASKAENEPNDEQMVDLFSLATNKIEPTADVNREVRKKGKDIPWRKTKKGKVTISIITILVILIIAAGVFAYFYINGALNKVTDDGVDYQAVETYDGMDFLQEDFPSIDEMDADEVSSYKDYLKKWYENGEPVNSTHVKNVLLIGEDTRDEKISDASRADSAIIVSVNIDTNQITMTSILRDLYVYFEIDGVGQYGKINAAASKGGMKEYINTVEKYYKIQIENYAVVNFASFPNIVDALNGVTINITSAEINEINSHQKRYGNVTIKQTFDGTEGKMKLNGKQALAYCRIRKIDSDGARADRQKTVLMQLLNQVKGSSTLDAAKVVNQLVGYVYTGYSKKELVSIGKYALSEGWLSYDTQTVNVPTAEHAKGGSFKTSSGAYRYGGWIWKSDIPQDAYDLQMKIYGKSNIKLSENRANYVEIL